MTLVGTAVAYVSPLVQITPQVLRSAAAQDATAVKNAHNIFSDNHHPMFLQREFGSILSSMPHATLCDLGSIRFNPHNVESVSNGV